MNNNLQSLRPLSALILFLMDSILLFGSYVLVAHHVSQVDGEFYLFYDNGLQQIAALVVVLQVAIASQLLYQTVILKSRVLLLLKTSWVLGVAFLYQALIGYALPSLTLPRSVIFYGSLLILVMFPAWRMAAAAIIRRTATPKGILFIGAPPTLPEIALQGQESEDFKVIGYLDAQDSDESLSVPRLGTIDELETTLRNHQPNHVVISKRWKGDPLPVRSLLDLQWSGLGVETSDAFYESQLMRVSAYDLSPEEVILSPMLQSSDLSAELVSQAIGLVALILAAPVLGVLILLLMFSPKKQRGPVLAAERRVGKRGREFNLYKFSIPAIPSAPASGWHAIHAWLINSRLYQLPILFNLIRGDMVLIGPAPERPEFLSILGEQIPFYKNLLIVKPGIVGWAQMNMRHENNLVRDVLTKLEYDFYYLKRRALALDTYITLHSFLP